MVKKHILFIVENASVPNDIRVWPEAQALKEFGYDVSVISPVDKKTSPKFEIINNIFIYRHWRPPEMRGKIGILIEYANALFWEFYLSLKVFFRKPFYAIHAANPPDHIFLIALLFKLFKVKYVFDHHDIASEMYLAKFSKPDFFYRILVLTEKINLKIADIVISTNESYKKFAIERGSKNHKDVIVVRNGPDLSRIKFMPPDKSLKNGFDYLVMYVGVIGEQEGIENLLFAVKHIVKKKIYNIKFIIVGTGPNWKKMVDMSKDLKITEFVEFTGFVSYERLYSILATSDLSVNPEFRNRFTDKSTMVKIMDYMTFGKPIVQFYTKEGEITAGNAADYIHNNDVVEFAEAIVRLLNDKTKRERMGAIGRERIQRRLSWQKQKMDLKEAYIRLGNIHCLGCD
jgi:glycosyltransferase involved in cell wall biosynthesis